MTASAHWLPALHELARRTAIDTGYWDVQGTYRAASPEGLVAILGALGVAIERPDGAEEALRRTYAALWSTPVEPCAASFGGAPVALGLRVPADTAGTLEVVLELESGERIERAVQLACLPVVRSAGVEGIAWVERRLDLPAGLPVGYHQVHLTVRGGQGDALAARCLLLAAPATAHAPPGQLRTWGVFAPLYALRSEEQLGVGDLGDLRALARFVAEQGGSMVGTLPLLAAFYRTPFQPSPYSPATRLFWNELFADLRPQAVRALGLPDSHVADHPTLRDAAAAMAGARLVDYRRAAALKRRGLERLVQATWRDPSARARVEAFATARPRVDDYARFRALTDTLERPWGEWPEAQRDGVIRDGEFDEDARRYHLFGQWLLGAQLADLKSRPETAGLYLDLPVGVDSNGYDLWRERASFASEISVGAPPDPLFWGGQNWALPPLHPVRQRESGYRYFIDCVRAHMEHAAMLRVDHVMGLHRLFWIPPGGSASDGVYVRYPADELYAILLIESRRQQCALAGEDLGTVPEFVRPMMAERGVHGLFVAQFAWDRIDGRAALRAPEPGHVASLDTHDTPTFAGFAEAQGLADEAPSLMRRWLDELAASQADVVLVTLEDLWLEREPQNVPGSTDDEQPNWRRRMQLDLDSLRADRGVLDTLRSVDQRRKGPA